MSSLLLRIVVWWLVVSVVVMAAMTTVVMVLRSRGARGAAAVIELSPRRARGDGGAAITITDRDDTGPDVGLTLPTRGKITGDSSVLERLLAGANLPCDLQPAPTLDPDRWMFVTAGHQPRTVALAVVEELHRLGLEVTPVGYTEARARREGLELSVTVHADEDLRHHDESRHRETGNDETETDPDPDPDRERGHDLGQEHDRAPPTHTLIEFRVQRAGAS